MPTLKIQLLRPEAVMPSYANPGDAGMDLSTTERVVLKPGRMGVAPTGLAFQLPRGTVGLVWDKSGLATKQGLKVLGGVIDAGYRGEVMVGLVNLGPKTVTLEAGHKVAQLLVQSVHRPRIARVAKLSSTARGDKGFGSSGK
jgi:dUTP pyrophosphatase